MLSPLRLYIYEQQWLKRMLWARQVSIRTYFLGTRARSDLCLRPISKNMEQLGFQSCLNSAVCAFNHR